MRPTPAKHLRDLLEHTSLIAYLKHADGRYIYVNRMYEAAAGVPADKIIGRTDHDIFPEPVAKLFLEQDRQVMEKKAAMDFEETIPLPDGAASFITSKFPLCDEKGKVWAVGGVCTNVTALKKAEEAVRASETRLNALIANVQEGCMIVDREGVIRYGSPAFLPLLGYQPEEVVGRHIREFMRPDEMAVSLPGFDKVARTPGAVSPRELHIRHKDGSWRTIEGRATNHMSTPNIEGVLINFRDVTARRIAKDHLIESERLYRALVETTNTGYVVVDGDGRVVDANAEYVRLTGRRSIDDIRGRSVAEWTAPEDRERNAREVAMCFAEGLVRNLEIDYVDREGRRIPIEINATVVRMGEKPLIMTLCRDISARRTAEEELRRSRENLAEAERLAGIGSVFHDLKAGRYYRSEGIHRIFGVGKEEMPDEWLSFMRFVHEDDRDRLGVAIKEAIASGSSFAVEYRIRRPDGAERIIHAEGEAALDADGRPLRFVAWLQDITERRALEEKVLRIGDRERRSIGHDLHDDIGQQLTGIALLGRALQERLAAQSSPEAPAMSELLKHVDNALLRVREMSRGLQSVPSRPEGLLDALTGLASHASATAGIACAVEAGSAVEVADPGMADHLYRIAQEAVHNAVRHGRPKGVVIALSEDNDGLTLSVRDDGTGLLAADKKASGMGFDIMRHRASLIHGTLTVSSQSGKGTQIICRVPNGNRAMRR
ncbi:MAG: PAS domain S-box protein [Elusimicrobia bacterium]|nr:PAS domain S-box protein [Elusimicrobiota bacterium]